MDIKNIITGLVLSLLLGNGVAVAAADSAEDDFMAGWRIYFDLVTNNDATNEDYKPAVKLLKLAALQGHSGAQSLLGSFYRTGKGILENDKVAVKWITLAAKQGDGNAQYSLGEMYEAGEGVEQDYIKAYMWFSLADHNGTQIYSWGEDKLDQSEPQKQEKRDLVSIMTTDEINKAQDMSSRCLESNYTDC
jgi:TPR repeat protein